MPRHGGTLLSKSQISFQLESKITADRWKNCLIYLPVCFRFLKTDLVSWQKATSEINHNERAKITSLGSLADVFREEMGRKEAVRLEIVFVRGVRTLGTVHIDLTLSLLIIQLISTREPRRGALARRKKQKWGEGGGGGTHAVISCHVIVTAERLWQL